MTDPIDDGDREDDYGWGRGGGTRPAGRGRSRSASEPEPEEDSASMAERLARLRDGLEQGAARRVSKRASGALHDAYEKRALDRGPREPAQDDPGAPLPDSIDRAIDRVGDLFNDIDRDESARDPYAEHDYDAPGRPGDPAYDEGFGVEAPASDPFEAYEPAPEPRRRGRAAPDPEEVAEREAARSEGRQSRRAARERQRVQDSQEGDFGAAYDAVDDPTAGSGYGRAAEDRFGVEDRFGAEPLEEDPRGLAVGLEQDLHLHRSGFDAEGEPGRDDRGRYASEPSPRFDDAPTSDAQGDRYGGDRQGAGSFGADAIDLDRFDMTRPGVESTARDSAEGVAPNPERGGRWSDDAPRGDDEPEIDFAFDDSGRSRDPAPRRRRRSLRARDGGEAGEADRLELRSEAPPEPQSDASFGAEPNFGAEAGFAADAAYDDDFVRPDPRPAAAPTERKARAPKRRGAGAFGSLERLLAGRYLRARRKEGFISVIAFLSLIGITLAVAVLIVVMSVMNGFRAELIDKMVGVNGHLIITPLERDFDDYGGAAKLIRAVPGVTRAAPLIEAKAFASSPRGGEGVLVRGVSKSDLLTLNEIAVSPERSVGDLGRFGEGDGIAIGAGLAQRLGITIGDTISLLSPTGAVTPVGIAPKRRVFDVDYVFKMGMSNYDDVLVFMPIEKAQSFFGRGGAADYIEVKVATPDRLDGYADDIESAVGRPIAITSWMENNGLFIGALETEQSVMFLILSLLILIASLIIISGLIMLVKEKGSDIAILRTMGLSRGGVMRVFFMCGATIGVLGAALGVALGVVVAMNVDAIKVFVEELTGAQLFPSEIYQFSALPSRLDWNDVGFTLAITLGLSFLATLYPAWRAARLDPVEALRYE